MPQEPYIIFGQFLDKNGNAVSNATITVKNLSTGDTFTVVTGANGNYNADCANFGNGFSDGDKVRLYGASSESIVMDIYFSVDCGKTWQQVNNNEEATITANTTRIKIDQVNYPGGIADLNITLIA